MPLLSRTAVRTRTTLYALSVLAIFCSNPAAAEPITIALLGPQSISPVTPLTQVRHCPSHEVAACRRNLKGCLSIFDPWNTREVRKCQAAYHECIEECHAGD
jgi:hypothetical protein